MLKLKNLVLVISFFSWALTSFAAKEVSSLDSEIMKDTERLLKLARPELEKLSSKLTPEQKNALKSIAFNKDSDLQVRWRALVLAARLMGEEMRSDITAASKSSDWFMRSASMMAAAELSSEEAATLARRLVNDKALVVRSAAVDILGHTGEGTDRRLLWKIIDDPINVRKGQSLWIRSQALQILARSPKKNEVSEFVRLLRESDLELQAISIHALEKATDFQFGSSQESIQDHRKRWLNWWDVTGKTKSL